MRLNQFENILKQSFCWRVLSKAFKLNGMKIAVQKDLQVLNESHQQKTDLEISVCKS